MTTDAEFDSLLPAATHNRREFLAASLGAGFALAVQPALAQTPNLVRTDGQGLSAGEVRIPVADGELLAYAARPEGATAGGWPTVLVVSEIFGVHEYIQDVCRRLAKLGYLAIAPELFTRQGDPRSLSSIPDIQAKITSRTPDTQVFADLDASVAWAGRQGGDLQRLAVTGFCWGGRITWLYAAHNPKVRAGVAWYGRLVGTVNEFTPQHPTDIAAHLTTPVLGLYGGQDAGIPQETVEQMRQALALGRSTSHIHVYPDAPHAFHADYRPSFRAEAAADGWQRLLEWLKQHGVR
ncbi:dienelactone hydrolase family protein [Dechloromonas sp. ZY10]|uniref:dienelactone hydrolase family protein n=1 Tax=Dechloromonas aquae TaxID=2664436 RepID=UPI003528332C